ncbi:MAG: gamma-glutamylcyclotransferase family protein [Salaquimonas sp.]
MSDQLIAYFGYGSLVNLQTLRTAYVGATPARLKGWRRHWQARPGVAGGAQTFSPALLSVHRAGPLNVHIEGMLIVDHLKHLGDLDEREAHYDRVLIGEDLIAPEDNSLLNSIPPDQRFVYVGRKTEAETSALLQSYLDAVMAGFLHTYGESGVMNFIHTTIGFDRHIIEDRKEPIYPRSVQISDSEAIWFDKLLSEAGVKYAKRGQKITWRD